MIRQVSGPPCAGKSTYIRLRALTTDLVLDDDQLAAQHGGRDAIPPEVWDAWFTRQRDAIRRHDTSTGRTLWIVRGAPEPLNGVHAMRVLTPSRAECHRRADRDGRPAATHEWIDRWFDRWG